MLQSIQQVIEERLKTEGAGNVKADRFAELAGRLLASGVLWREFSRPEADLYDDRLKVRLGGERFNEEADDEIDV